MAPSAVLKRAVLSARRVRAVDRVFVTAVTYRSLAPGHPVLVFQMGKTGSTSVLAALEEHVSRPVVHCHVISKEGLAYNEKIRKQERIKSHYRPDWRGDAVRRWLASHPQEPVDIVTMVREPVGHAFSVFFQVGDDFGYLDERAHGAGIDVDSARDVFIASYASPLHRRDWFDAELAAVTGVDVYATPFDTARGYQVYERGRFRVLLLRYEDLRRVAAGAMGEFLGQPEIAIPDRNVSEDKSTGDAYRKFRDTIRLPGEWLDQVYALPMAQHFYTAEERARYAQRWAAVREASD